jgi:ribosomal protein L29
MKSRDEKKDLRGLAVDELKKRILSQREELMKLRFRKAGGQLAHSAELQRVRRSIARGLTVLAEKQKGAQG